MNKKSSKNERKANKERLDCFCHCNWLLNMKRRHYSKKGFRDANTQTDKSWIFLSVI